MLLQTLRWSDYGAANQWLQARVPRLTDSADSISPSKPLQLLHNATDSRPVSGRDVGVKGRDMTGIMNIQVCAGIYRYMH